MAKNSQKVLKISRAFRGQHRQNLSKCLNHIGVEVRRDVRKDQIQFRKGKGPWQQLVDDAEADIEQTILEHCTIEKGSSNDLEPVAFQPKQWTSAMRGIVKFYQTDPFLDWLESLPKWDGTPRVKTLIENCFEVDGDVPKEIFEFASYAPLVAAVRRAKNPGEKFDHMVILQGGEGVEKSTYWKELLPDPEFFSDDLDFGDRKKEKAEAVAGKVFVECDELKGMATSRLSSLKSFITRTVDYYRGAYDTRPSDHKRRCVLVGSANPDECLPDDPGGNRRFIVIPIKEKPLGDTDSVIRDYLRPRREQIWAEAIVLEEKGEKIYLSRELRDTVIKENERFRSRPNEALENIVDDFIREHPNGEWKLAAIEKEAFERAGRKNPQPNDRKVVKERLKSAGAYTKRHGVKGRFWILPSGYSPSDANDANDT